MKYQIFRIALGLILLMSTAEQAWAQLPPFFTICCAPDSSQLWVPVIDTATSSATYGRAVFRDSTYLATALGVGSAAAAGGIYAAANSGSNIGEGQQEVNIPDGDTLIFDLNSITGLGGRIRFQNTGDRYIEMFNPTTASWTWNAYNGVSQQGQFQMGANVILSAGNGVDITAQTSDILIETEDNLPIVLSTYTDGGTYGTDIDLAQDPFARFDVTTQTIGGKILTIAQGSQRDNGVVIGEDFAQDTSNIVYAGQEGVRLGSEDGYWFEDMDDDVRLPSVKDLDTVLAVNPVNGRWHIADATTWTENIFNHSDTITSNRVLGIDGTNVFTIQNSSTNSAPVRIRNTAQFAKGLDIEVDQGLALYTNSTSTGGAWQMVTAVNSAVTPLRMQFGTGGVSLEQRTTSASSDIAVFDLVRETTGTPVAGFGSHLRWEFDNSVNANRTAGLLGMEWADPTNGSEDTNLEITLTSNGAQARDLLLEGATGALTLDNYATGQFGVETALLGTTATGQVVRIDLDSADIVGGGGTDFNWAEDNLTTDAARTHSISNVAHNITYEVASGAGATEFKYSKLGTTGEVQLRFFTGNSGTGALDGAAIKFDNSASPALVIKNLESTGSVTIQNSNNEGVNIQSDGQIRFDAYNDATHDDAGASDHILGLDETNGDIYKLNIADYTDTNFAEDNLTTDGIRTHTIGHAVTFNQSTAGDITIQKDHATSTELTFEISNQSTGDNIMYFNGVAESEDWSIGTDNSVDLFRIANSATLSGTPRFGINGVGAIRFDVYTTGGGVVGTEVGLLGHTNNGTVTSIPLGTDGQVLTMVGTSDFTWGTPSGSSLWTDGGATTYLTATGDNVNIGATTADEKLHIEVTTGDAYIKVQGGGVDATDEVGIKFFDGATADSKIEFEEVGTESIMRFSVEAETPLEIYEDAAAWSASDAYLNVDAGMVYGRVTQTSINLTLDEGHYCVYVTSGTVTITLPTTPDIGRQYFIINNSGNDCTIDPGVTSSTCATSGIDCINFVDASNYTLSTTESIIIMAIGTDGSGGWDWVTIE